MAGTHYRRANNTPQTAYPITGETAPERPAAIPQALDELNAQLVRLSGDIGVLTERLGPVLRPDADKPAEAPVREPTASLANTLFGMVDDLRQSEERLSLLISRLEL